MCVLQVRAKRLPVPIYALHSGIWQGPTEEQTKVNAGMQQAAKSM